MLEVRKAIKWLQATPNPTLTPTSTPTFSPTPNQRLEDNFKRLPANPPAQHLPQWQWTAPATVDKVREQPSLRLPPVEAKLDGKLEAKLEALSKLEGKLDELGALVRGLVAREPARHAAPEGEHGSSRRPAAAEAEGVAALRANLEVISQQVRQAALNP